MRRSWIKALVWAVLLAVSARPAPADAPEQVLAVYKDGKITVSQVKAQAADMTRISRNIHTFATAEDLYKAAARRLALKNILLSKAAEDGIQQMAGWSTALKLIECSALAELMLDTTWSSVQPTQTDIDKFALENPAMAHPPVPSEGQAQQAGKTVFAPSDKDWLAWVVRSDQARPLINELTADAKSRWPARCAGADEWGKGSDDAVVLGCGAIQLTRKDVRALSETTGVPIESCSQVYLINNMSEEVLSLGELAREKGYALKPGFADLLRGQRESWLIWIAKNRLIEEMLASYTPTEDEILDYWQKSYKGVQEQVVKFEAIVCPVVVPPDASAEEQAAARKMARAAAADVIDQIKRGASFETIRAQHPEYRYMPDCQSTIDPYMTRQFDQQMAVLGAGDVASEPIEDYGGFCVMKVVENTPRQKMPLQYARGEIVEDLRFAHRTQLMTDPDGAILDRYGFAIRSDVLAALAKSAQAGDDSPQAGKG